MKGACQCLADRAPPGPAPRGCCSYLGRLPCHPPLTSSPWKKAGMSFPGLSAFGSWGSSPLLRQSPGEGRGGLDPGSPVPTMHTQTHTWRLPQHTAQTPSQTHTDTCHLPTGWEIQTWTYAAMHARLRRRVHTGTQRQAQATTLCTHPCAHRYTHALTPTHAWEITQLCPLILTHTYIHTLIRTCSSLILTHIHTLICTLATHKHPGRQVYTHDHIILVTLSLAPWASSFSGRHHPRSNWAVFAPEGWGRLIRRSIQGHLWGLWNRGVREKLPRKCRIYLVLQPTPWLPAGLASPCSPGCPQKRRSKQ